MFTTEFLLTCYAIALDMLGLSSTMATSPKPTSERSKP